MKIYVYDKCSTCRNALQWADGHNLAYTKAAIRETPPSTEELKTMLGYYNGELKRLFNTSGMDYRALGLKDRLPGMSEEEALELLTSNGNLVKRPFALGNGKGLVGFRPKEWEATWL